MKLFIIGGIIILMEHSHLKDSRTCWIPYRKEIMDHSGDEFRITSDCHGSNRPHDAIFLDLLIEEAHRLFPEDLKPRHFTDFEHCDECREHDETLRTHSRESITYAELGNPGYDPMCFVDEHGMKYYFPAMIRLALRSTIKEYYVDHFLLHISYNRSCIRFSRVQCSLVIRVLKLLKIRFADEIELLGHSDEMRKCLERWYGLLEKCNHEERSESVGKR